MRGEVAKRPRDPFTHIYYLIFRGEIRPDAPPELLRVAQDMAELSRLIPENSFYDESRYAFADLTSDYAVTACLKEYISKGAASKVSRQAAELALNQVETMRALDPDDYTGYTRFCLGLALMLNDRAKEAIPLLRQVAKPYEGDPGWLFWSACAQSMVGNHPIALQQLEQSIANGQWDLELIRAMPQLKPLAAAKPHDFAQLVTPQWEWSVTNDWFWDDILLTNHSAFPLTSVQFTVHLTKGNTSETLELEIDNLPPGQTHTWTDAVSGPRGEWDDQSTATLQCDQLP